MGYRNTFIAVAEDCKATTGEVPPLRAGARTVAGLQHAMLAAEPARLQEEDVLLACAPGVRGRADLTAAELQHLREEYFAQPRACLRPRRCQGPTGGACTTTDKAGSRCTQWTLPSTSGSARTPP